jgi:small nuclear ribonucleoprotein (snRNP)-like protein
MDDYFKGRKAALATMHSKEKVIAPILKQIGIEVIVPQTLNTDAFGTFTKDIDRAGNQLEAARAKAYAALALTGLDLAIASEGSFGADPQIPFIQSNLELILLVDTKNNLEIRGHYRSSDTNMNGSYVSTIEEARRLTQKWGFPGHGVIVRKSEKGRRYVYKDIVTHEDLEQRVMKLLQQLLGGQVYIETDMRAHKNPTRMQNIAKATEDLVKNIQRLCPKCGSPGFAVVDIKRGVPCASCTRPTNSPTSLVYKCFKCEYTQDSLLPESDTAADPGMCTYCNP